jgi:polyhydroxybutyrate depolymerase
MRRRLQARQAARAGEPGSGAWSRSHGLVNLPAVPVEQTLADWARVDGSAPSPAVERIGSDVRHVAYRGGRNGTSVDLYAVEGGGHVWPGARDVTVPLLGRTTHTIDATALMIERWSTLQRRP